MDPCSGSYGHRGRLHGYGSTTGYLPCHYPPYVKAIGAVTAQVSKKYYYMVT